MRETFAAMLVVFATDGVSRAQFADRLAPGWYVPAPGQFVNDPLFNDPSRALGAPAGGGLLQPDNTSLVSLGGFGGSIVLGFSTPVIDDPCNPFGLDAIVFGNAFFVAGNAERKWAEPGIIEISVDANGNGQPDDTWYPVRFPTLAQPPVDGLASVTWDDDAGTALPPALASWFPSTAPAGLFTTTTYDLGVTLSGFVLENSNETFEDFFALTDLTPTLLLGDLDADNVVEDPSLDPAAFYTRPDNPRVVGVTPGSGGGDAFDIAWAIDPATGEPAQLPSFDFVRISTSVDRVVGPLGEVSTEVDAVADVSPKPLFFDVNDDGRVGVEDVYASAHAGAPADADVDGDLQVTPADARLTARCARVGEIGDALSER